MTYLKKVHAAVNDDEWQKFRKSLKGISTKDKLERLGEYYLNNIELMEHNGIEPCGACDICIRVDNYLKALCRGGQLYAGTDLEQAVEKQFHFGVPIKRN